MRAKGRKPGNIKSTVFEAEEDAQESFESPKQPLDHVAAAIQTAVVFPWIEAPAPNLQPSTPANYEWA